jgi:hypothetical protein
MRTTLKVSHNRVVSDVPLYSAPVVAEDQYLIGSESRISSEASSSVIRQKGNSGRQQKEDDEVNLLNLK